MTHEERKVFGQAAQAARKAKGWSISQLLTAITVLERDFAPSTTSLKRMELGGALLSEANRNTTLQDSEFNARLRSVVAKVFGMPAPSSGTYAPKAVAPPIPPPAPKNATSAPQPVTTPAPADKKDPWANARAKRAINQPGHEAKTPSGYKQTYQQVYFQLENKHGFSRAAVRTTLTNLNRLGLPTVEVKRAMMEQFAKFLDSIDRK